ncbi:Pentatricopeptide repeat [Dillenia turbinata]|uniref:Pentatricopeptide repeat n=1 Tax=Dillenia turbinata TaxID=194707 RepID=A0AAN8UG69_9MAGN
MYAKCGCVEKAREVFDKRVEGDVVIWNSMLSSYSQNGHPEDCLFLSTEMASLGGLRPMVVTLAADIAALPQGRELHGFSWWHGFEVQVKVKTALVDMYAKSGAMKVARNLFGRQMEKNILLKCDDYWVCDAWTCSEALRLFEEMKREALPDHIMVVGVLSGCSHAGMVEEGQTYSDLMVGDYNITLTVPYYALVPDSGLWGALFNSCKICGNVELAEMALRRFIELEPDDAGNYVIVSSMYAEAGNWEGVAGLRKLMTDQQIKNALLVVGQRVGGLLREAGYVPNTAPVFHDDDDDEKSRMVMARSERRAIAFGLISTAPGTRLLITKNLKVCEDCHVAIKFISNVTGREIIVRGVNHYHHLKMVSVLVVITGKDHNEKHFYKLRYLGRNKDDSMMET